MITRSQKYRASFGDVIGIVKANAAANARDVANFVRNPANEGKTITVGRLSFTRVTSETGQYVFPRVQVRRDGLLVDEILGNPSIYGTDRGRSQLLAILNKTEDWWDKHQEVLE